MPEPQNSLLFSRYIFSEEEKVALRNIISSPLFQAYISHSVAEQVQKHILLPISSFDKDTDIHDNEMFIKGVVQLAMDLLTLSNIDLLGEDYATNI